MFLVIAAVVAAVSTGLLLRSGADNIVDTPIYRLYGELIAHGKIPYRDFSVEYPPLATAVFTLPALVTDRLASYEVVFGLLMLVSLVGLLTAQVWILKALRADATQRAFTMRSVLLGVLLLGPFVATRFDLVPATLTAAAVGAFVGRRNRVGACLLGASIATKLYALVVLPLAVIYVWRRSGRREGVIATVLTCSTVLVAFFPFLVASPGGVWRSLDRQLARPLEIESLAAGVLLALHHLAGVALTSVASYGSQNLAGSAARIAATVTTVAGIAAILAVWARYARGSADANRFVRYSAAGVVAFVAFGKVLSPQFLVWLLALIPLVAGRRGKTSSVLLLVSCLLTRLWFPGRFWGLVNTFDEQASWLVLVRGSLLAAILGILIWPAANPRPCRATPASVTPRSKDAHSNE